MKQRFAIIALFALTLASVAPVGQPTLAAQPTTARILRDPYGVPHIYADTLYDLFYANGYAMTQDRLTQLELYRRASLGRLAEALGPDMLESDIAARRELYTRAERDALLAALPAQQQVDSRSLPRRHQRPAGRGAGGSVADALGPERAGRDTRGLAG